MTINGVPAHPLIVHAAVVFVPMAALAVAALAFPRWRWIVRWPALALSLAAAAAVQLAAMTGDQLAHQVGQSRLVANHEMWAGRLQAGTWVMAGVAVVAFWALPHTTKIVGASDREAKLEKAEKPLMVLLPLLAVAVLALVVATGDAGAQAVWAKG